MSLIEKDEALKRVEDAPVLSPMSLMTKSYIYAGIKTMPDVDAVPVVRCRDCKHYKDGLCYFTMRRYGLHDDWFCADGEREDKT